MTASYNNQCYTEMNFNVTGGTPPYTYILRTPENNYTSDSSSIPLYSLGLNTTNYTSSLMDSNGCIHHITRGFIEGREYAYSGSYCES